MLATALSLPPEGHARWTLRLQTEYCMENHISGLFIFFNFYLRNPLVCDKINPHFPEFSIRVRSGSSASESRDLVSQSMGGSAYAEKHRE